MQLHLPLFLRPSTWVNIGVDEHLKEYEKRRIRVLNIANVAIICYSGSFTLVELSFYKSLTLNYLLADSLNLPFTILSIFLTYKRWYTAGKLVSVIANMSIVVILKLFFNDSGLELVGIVGIIGSIFLFEKWTLIISMLLFSMAGYLLLTSGFNPSSEELISLPRLKQVCMFILIFLILYTIRNQMIEYHKTLSTQKKLLVEKNRELDELNSLKTRLFSIVSHDLRGPIGALELCFQDLQDNNLSEKEFRLIFPEMLKSVGSINLLLKSLLQWSHSQLAHQPSLTEKLEIQRLIDQQFTLFQLQARRKNIRLQAYFHPKQLTAIGDRNILETILRNLTSNAIKFSKPGGVIKLEAVGENGFITISVTDAGVGMSATQIQDIYEFKVKKTKGTDKEEGSGLGLLLTQQLLQKTGSKLYIESKLNIGTSISFRLPAFENAVTGE
jgi:signal transduction histidine kinase